MTTTFIQKTVINTVPLSNLSIGDGFKFNDKTYIKTRQVFQTGFNTINLITMEGVEFTSNCSVTPIDLEIIEKVAK